MIRDSRKLIRICSIIMLIMMLFAVPVSAYTYDGGGGEASYLNSPNLNIVKKLPNNKNDEIIYSLDGTTLTVTGVSKNATIPTNAFVTNGILGKDTPKVKKIVIKGTITTIDSFAFLGCSGVTSVTLNDGLKLIRVGAFGNASKLSAVTIPASVNHVQDGAFIKTVKISCKNKALEKYGINGYKTNDTLGVTVSLDYTKAYDMLDLINNERSKKKIKDVYMDSSLMQEAMTRAVEIAVLSSNTRPNGEMCFSINGDIYAENIASGGLNATEVMYGGRGYKGFMDNKSNKATITDSRYTSAGIGCVQYNGVYYWVQLFGNKKITSNCKKPSNTTDTRLIEFPYGTNNYLLNGRNAVHTFKLSTSEVKVGVGESKSVDLKLGNVTFVRSTGKWSSDNTKVAKVSKGTITGVGFGTTYVQAGSRKTGGRAKVKVIVYEVKRLAGQNLYGTSLEAAKHLKSKLGVSKFANAVVAYGGNFPDALSGTYLANKMKAPMLLIDSKREDQIINYIKSNVSKSGTIYILGGTAVVSSSVDKKLKSAGYKIKRCMGNNQYGTNLDILKTAGIKGQDVIVCTGKGYADSLSASSVGKPILLVNNKLTSEQLNYLKSAGTSKKAYIIGGKLAVSEQVDNQLKSIGFTVVRVAGNNMYDTSIKVAKTFFPDKIDTVTLAYAKNYPDGLSGGPVAAAYKSPMILVTSSNYKQAVTYAKSVGARRVITMGGKLVIPDNVPKAIASW